MKHTSVHILLIAGFLISGFLTVSMAACEEAPNTTQPPENKQVPQDLKTIASVKTPLNTEGRLVYFVDGSRFDEDSELPADEENITWGVVYDNPEKNGEQSGYFSRVAP